MNVVKRLEIYCPPGCPWLSYNHRLINPDALEQNSFPVLLSITSAYIIHQGKKKILKKIFVHFFS